MNRWYRPPASDVAWLGLAAAILLGCGAFVDFIADDSYITFRYAYNLVHHGQLVFNLGERVEGYTNPLWTISLAGLHALGAPFEPAARYLGVVFAIASLLVVYQWARIYGARWAALAPVFLALSPSHSTWAFLGLEPTMLGAFIVAGFFYLDPNNRSASDVKAGVAFAAAYLTRPEGALAIALFVAVVLFRQWGVGSRQRSSRDFWTSLFIPLATIAGHVTWRRFYYGQFLPNTFHVKSLASTGMTEAGLVYVAEFLVYSGGLLLAVVATVRIRRSTVRYSAGDLAAIAFGVLFLLYLVAIGGDYMGASRFAVPLAPLIAIGLFRTLLPWDNIPTFRAAATLAATLAVLSALTVQSLRLEFGTVDDGFITRVGAMRTYVRTRLAAGAWLRRSVSDRMSATSSAVGVMAWLMLPARVIDARGLTNPDVIAVGGLGPFRPGHTLFASDEYLLSQQADLLLHRYALTDTAGLARAVDRVDTPGYHPLCVNSDFEGNAIWLCFALRGGAALGAVDTTSREAAPGMIALVRAQKDGQVQWTSRREIASLPTSVR